MEEPSTLTTYVSKPALSKDSHWPPSPLKKNKTLTYEPGRTNIETHDDYEYDDFRPIFPDVHWEPLTEVPYQDRGIQGDPQFRNLLADATDIFDYNPKIGTEVHGVNLAKLTNAQKDDLARLIATRGVVFFRNQTYLDIDTQRELSNYFGKLHRHATTSVPRRGDLDDVHVVYTDEKSKEQRANFAPTFLWHSDVSDTSTWHVTTHLTAHQVTYEMQPPSYTALKLLSGPPRGGGGDTLWSSQYAVYDLLSPGMQKYLEGLEAFHSAQIQADGSNGLGRPVRRVPVITKHPLVRTNPVTGWKSVFFNPGFVTAIVGIPKAESNSIIHYLNELIATTQELHVRYQWQKNDVAFWDNRVCVSAITLRNILNEADMQQNHSASYGFAPHRRHAIRTACHAERPVLDPAGKSQEEEMNARYGLPKVNKDGSSQSNYND